MIAMATIERMPSPAAATSLPLSEGSEWCDGVIDPMPPSRLLHVRQISATAIGDARLRDLFIGDRVAARDVLGTHNPPDVEDPHFRVDAEFLRAADHEIAVGQHVGD